MVDNSKPLEYKPGAFYFGISLESDLSFAERLSGKTKQLFIEAVLKAWSEEKE